MRIGVDFDNTIVSYDGLFHRVALEWGCIPSDLPVNKSEVRNHLRAAGREEVWTRMQGVVYGPRIAGAEPFAGVRDFFRACRHLGVPVCIISHKTLQPFVGEPHDLHAAAWAWLEQQGFFEDAQLGLPRDAVFFELTKAAKLERIAQCGCTHFIDDLPEFLAETGFPASTERILFDPADIYEAEARFRRVQSWSEAGRVLLAGADSAAGLEPSRFGWVLSSSSKPPEGREERGLSSRASSVPPAVEETRRFVASFLQAHGVEANFRLEPLPGGANNRVFLVDGDAGRKVLKVYYHAENDPRDRFQAERGFYDLAWSHGLRATPEPLGWDAGRRLGLFAYVEGRALQASEVTGTAVSQALDFVIGVNAARDAAAAANLPSASEACFSVQAHVRLVEERVRRLERISAESAVDREAADFVANELTPALESVRARIEAALVGAQESELARVNQCLSPSDFGFHNALLASDGKIRFFDFEYAGWDDPAKLVCDFFCQPRLPVPPEHWRPVVDRLDESLGWRGKLELRAALLLPLYRLKWCCIMLNEFLGSSGARRRFAQGDDAAAERKVVQLGKARAALQRLAATWC